MDRFLVDLILLPFGFGYIAILLKLASIWKNSGRMSGSTARKFIHVTVGLSVVAMPIIFSTKLVPLFIASTFIAISFITSPISPFSQLKLNSIGEGHTLGTTYYSLSFTTLIWLFFDTPWILEVGFLPLVVGDATAAYIGLKYGKRKWKIFDNKSLEGSLAGFLCTFIALEIVLILYKILNLFDFSYFFMFGLVSCISLLAMIAEIISPKGFDNLTIPLICSVFAVLVS